MPAQKVDPKNDFENQAKDEVLRAQDGRALRAGQLQVQQPRSKVQGDSQSHQREKRRHWILEWNSFKFSSFEN